MFYVSVSEGAVHTRRQCAGAQAVAINPAQDLSAVEVGLHDEIFQAATSTSRYSPLCMPPQPGLSHAVNSIENLKNACL
jgi:hypothetical protein